MWGDEAHLPAWPSGPSAGITARTLGKAWRAVRRYAAAAPPPSGITLNAWVGTRGGPRGEATV